MQSYNIYIHCNYTNIKPFINFIHMYRAKLSNIKQVYCKTNLVKKPESVCIWSDLIIKSLSHNHKFKSKLQGFKSILHCNGGLRVTFKVMACILVSQRLPFLMSLCNLDVPLWSARMLAVSNSFQRDKQCQTL